MINHFVSKCFEPDPVMHIVCLFKFSVQASSFSYKRFNEACDPRIVIRTYYYKFIRYRLFAASMIAACIICTLSSMSACSAAFS